MAQTKQGAMKVAARRFGISLEQYESLQEAGMKHCTKCKQWVPAAQFGIDRSRSDGLSTKCQGCIRVKVRKCMKGRPSAFKERKHTPEAKARMSAARVGKPGPWKGKKLPADIRARIAVVTRERTARGKDHYAYSHGKHQRDLDARRTPEYRVWREAVFARDRYTCQDCGDARGGNLQAHHVKSFADNPILRFDVGNGLTLCQDCHEKIHLKPIPMPADIRRRRKHR